MTGAGTGTPVVTTSGNTLAALRAQTRVLLASTADWPDATLDLFIGDAIRFYSSEYPRTLAAAISAVAGVQRYPIPGRHDVLAVLAVQVGDVWLTCVPAGSPELAGGYVYALVPVDDDLDPGQDLHRGLLLLGPPLAGGETIRVTYSATHRIPADDGDVITVPQAHWEALIAFVDFRCHWLMETGEIVAMAANTIALSQLGQESRLAWNRFKEVADRIAYRQQGQSAVVSWGERRIY